MRKSKTLVVLLLLTWLLLVVALATPRTTATPQPCHEDMACWSCETMGNLKCGEVK